MGTTAVRHRDHEHRVGSTSSADPGRTPQIVCLAHVDRGAEQFVIGATITSVHDPLSDALFALGEAPLADDARLALAQRFSYVVPDAESLAMVGALAPIVEIGAGTGYWASRLLANGVDVIAFDQAPPDGDMPNRYHARTPLWTEVRCGDQTVLPEYADRTLLLCWPPLFSSLGNCLSYYAGTTVALIGDGGKRTARLQSLKTSFACVATHPVRAVDPAPDAIAALSVWRRRDSTT
jgi:hypothetical protein